MYINAEMIGQKIKLIRREQGMWLEAVCLMIFHRKHLLMKDSPT